MRRVDVLLAQALLLWACGAGIEDDPNRADSNPPTCGPGSCAGRCGDVQDACGNTLICGACTTPVDASTEREGVEAHACAGQPAGWQNELADAAGDTGRFPSLGVDAAGTVHISYYEVNGGTIRYARRSPSGTWSRESVAAAGVVADAGDVGMGTSLKLDGGGLATIAFYDLANRDLKLARRRPSGDWALEAADALGDVGGWPSLVVDDAGAHVTYYDRTSKVLKAAHRDAQGAWSLETVDSLPAGWQSSFAADDQGGLHVTYSEQQAHLRYAYRPRDGQWRTTRVDGSEGLWSSVVVDALGGIHVSYCSSLLDGELLYAVRSGPVDWAIESVERGPNSRIGWSSALGVDTNGEEHIAYIDRSNDELRYAHRNRNEKWTTATLDTPGTPSDLGRYVALALDRDHAVHVAYYDARSGDLRYARLCP